MSRVFQLRAGGVRAEFTESEVELLRSLQQGVEQVLSEGDSDDPVIQRLFPAAVKGDDQADAEVRGLLREELFTARRHGLRSLVEILTRGVAHRGRIRIQLIDDEPLLFLGVLNDLRLALGARIGIGSFDRETAEVDDATSYRLAVMDHLGWWQEQLLDILDNGDVLDALPDEGS